MTTTFDHRALLEAVFALGRAVAAAHTRWAIDRDDTGFALSASVELSTDDEIVWVVPLRVAAVEAMTRLVVGDRADLATPDPGTEWRGVLELAVTPGPVPEASPDELAAEIVRLAETASSPTPIHWRVDGSVAANDLDTLIRAMATHDSRYVSVSGRAGQLQDCAAPPIAIRSSMKELTAFVDALPGPCGAPLAWPEKHVRAHDMDLRMLVVTSPPWTTQVEVRRVGLASEQPLAPTTDPVGDGLLTHMYEQPGSRDAEQVYADWLSEHSDPRGAMLSARPLAEIDLRTWLGDASLIGAVHPLTPPEVLAVVGIASGRPWSVPAMWRRAALERHWQWVDTLWFTPLTPRAVVTDLLLRAPLTRLRHLVVPYADLVPSLGRLPGAANLTTLTVDDSAGIEAVTRAIEEGAFPALQCWYRIAPLGDRATRISRPERLANRDVRAYTLHIDSRHPRRAMPWIRNSRRLD